MTKTPASVAPTNTQTGETSVHGQPAAAAEPNQAAGQVDDAPAPTVHPIAASVEANAEFDIEEGGRRAMAALQTCFSAARLGEKLDIGLSVYYPRAGVSKKVFFGGGTQISSEERSCISTVLVGLSAGGAPKNPTTVSYSFSLHGEQSRFKARLATN